MDEDFGIRSRHMASRMRHSRDWPDKGVKEKGIVADFVEQLYREAAHLRTASIAARGDGNDPPDCEIVTADGLLIGVELTELVDRRAIEKVKERQRKGHSPYLWAKWDVQKVTNGLKSRIKRKDKPNSLKGGPYSRYILLIHCDEHLISSELMRAACEEAAGMPTKLIDEAYVILGYDPNTKNYPIFDLNVKKGSRACT